MKNAIKIFSVITAVCLIVCALPFGVSAATSGSCGTNVNYVLDGTALTITGTGAVNSAPWNVSGSTVASVEIGSGVTSICDGAFDKCRNLTSAVIPASVTSIGDDAFYARITYTPVTPENPDDDGQVAVTYTYNVVFTCPPASYAESYALEKGIQLANNENPETPVDPVVSSVVNCTVTLAPVTGYEYSADGVNYQSSNVFTGLLPVTEYTFTQRIAAAGSYGPSAASNGVTATTGKSAPGAAPAVPTATATDSSITVASVLGLEYSLDGVTYQSSNVFSGLTDSTAYTVYVRYAETAAAEASLPASFTVTTAEYSGIGDINGDGTIDNADLIRFRNYVAGRSVTVNAKALDCNGDGIVDAADVVRLKKYLAGQSVTLG